MEENYGKQKNKVKQLEQKLELAVRKGGRERERMKMVGKTREDE